MLKFFENFQPSPILAYFLVAFATFLWALSIVILRGIHEEIPPIGLSSLRWFVGAAFLLPFVWSELWSKYPMIKDCFGLIFLMGVLQVGSSTLLVIGVNFTTAINAAVINASQPAITAAVAWVLIRDRITILQGTGIVVGLLGVLVIVTRAEMSSLFSMDLNLGDGFAVLAILGWGTYAVLVNRLPQELGMTTLLFLVILTGSFASLPFYIWESIEFKTVPFTFDTIITLLFLGIIVSVGSIYIWNCGIRAVGPNKASIFLNLIPVFGAILAVSFLDERIFLFHVLGATMICMGIILAIKRI